MKLKYCLLALLWPVLNGYAQSPKMIPQLGIGDILPATEMKTMINYKDPSANTADFNDRLLILDFWSTWCSSCIASWPKTQALQKEFGDKVKILLVNGQEGGRKKVQVFLDENRNKKFLQYMLPSAIEDTVLSALFKHRVMPHIAWIGKGGKVMAISDGGYLTSENIQAALSGRFSLPLKKDSMNLDFSRPLLAGGNGAGDDYFIYRSVLSRFIRGIPVGISKRKDENGDLVKLTCTNNDITNLYKTAYGNELPAYFHNHNIDIKLRDSTRYNPPKDFIKNQLWVVDNMFCYESIVPNGSGRNKIYTMMRNDLDQFFNIESYIEKRELQCLALRRKKDPMKPGQQNKSLKPANKPATAIRLSTLVEKMNMLVQMPIVVDELGGEYGSDPIINANIRDLPAIKKELETYGFELAEIKKEMKVLVIREK